MKWFRKKIEFDQIVKEFINSYSLIIDPQKVIHNTRGRIISFFPDYEVDFLIREDEQFVNNSGTIKISRNSELVNWLTVNSSLLDIENSTFKLPSDELKILSEFNPNYVSPMESHNRLSGIVLIKSKKINPEILSKMEILFRFAAMAFENANRMKNERKQMKIDSENEKQAVIGRMSSYFAHEIRNPLTSIRSSIQFLEKVNQKEEHKDILSGLIEEVDRINGITSELLNYSRPRQLEIEEIEISKLLCSVHKLFDEQLKESNVNIKINNSGFDKLIIRGNEDALKQIFINFMVNSIDAVSKTEEKKISINIIRKDDRFYLEWIDSGSGIDKESLSKIFEPFYSTKVKGTGLGLAISKRFLEQMGYDLNVTSKVGKGTRFYFVVHVIKTGVNW